MKNIITILLLTNALWAEFNFGECSGSGTFEQQIIQFDNNYENATTVGEIPSGIQGLKVFLISDKDVDIRLYGENNDKIVHWPHGIHNQSTQKTKLYKNIAVTYSGYNGVSGQTGHEFIEIPGTTPTAMTMKAFGYQSGYALVNYSWTGKEGCLSKENGDGNFTQNIIQGSTTLVGTIPPNVNNIRINLTSEKDLDIQLYGEDGTTIVSWKPQGLLSGSTKQSIIYHDMNITWSGYNGTDGHKGHEYITITQLSSEMLVMKVYGYESGYADVTYTWGELDTTKPVITLNGASIVTLTIGDTYSDAGATANDNEDDNITTQISVHNPVNTAIEGNYTITYNVNDTAGNSAEEVTRTVRVKLPVDITPPVITLNGGDMTFILGATYTELGATATDDIDTNVTVDINGTVDTSTAGTYTVVYTAIDRAGNKSILNRIVRIVELNTQTSQISLGTDDAEERNSGSMYLNSSDIELTEDGSSTQTIGLRFQNISLPKNAIIASAFIQFQVDETSSTSTQLNIYGEKTNNAVTYTSQSNNITSRTKTNAFTAWTPLSWETIGEKSTKQQTSNLKNIVQEIITDTAWSSNNAMAFMIIGTGKRVAESYDGSSSGAPTLHIQYTLGDVPTDTTPPVITLNGGSHITLFQGDTYTELGATATDNIDGDVSVNISGQVNTAVLNDYTISYTATDTKGNSETISRIVSIIEKINTNTLERGPYLQQGSSHSMIIKWRTENPSGSKIIFGTSLNALNSTSENTNQTTEHILKLTDLQPNTRYYYQIGSKLGILLPAQSNTYFQTSPTIDSNNTTRIWVIGDSGTKDQNARNVYNAYRNFSQSTYTNLWLMLGDNAYNSGTDAEYQSAVFDMYPELLRQTPLWSTRGNHETYSGKPAYFDIFTFPTNGEVGGQPSGSEHYYSFNHGNIHFIVLDSMENDLSSNSPMAQWMENDLQYYASTTDLKWLIAIWHHPPYTKGSHNSDVEPRLTYMRTNFLPMLESFNVDLVLSGHSHAYERSKFIKGHYNNSSNFNASHIVQQGSGNPSTDGAYTKLDINDPGTVYTVAGASGKISGGSLNHPAMQVSLRRLGSVILDINSTVLDVKYLSDQGTILDTYRIQK